jgi:hypothetical protein
MELMQRLQQLANRRASEERVLAATLSAQLSDAEREFEETARRLNEDFAERRRALENDYAAAKQLAATLLEQGQRDAQTAWQDATQQSNAVFNSVVETARKKSQDSEWQALAVFDASKNQPQQKLDETQKRLQAKHRQLDGLERDALTLLDMRRLSAQAMRVAPPISSPPAPRAANAEDALQRALAEVRQQVLDLQDQRVASLLLEGHRWILWLILVTAVATLIAGFASNMTALGWAIGGAAGLAAGGAMLAYFLPRGRRWSLEAFAAIQLRIDDARRLEDQALADAQVESQRLSQEIISRRDADVTAATQLRDRSIAEAQAQHTAELAKADAARSAQLEALALERDRAIAEAEAKFPPLLEHNAEQRRQAESDNAARFEARRAAASLEHEAAWKTLADEWLAGFREVVDELDVMHARAKELFLDWSAEDWESWRRPAEPPEAIRFGQSPLPMQLVKNAVPEDPRLDPGVKRLLLPATMTLQEQPRLVITADGAGRRAAAETLGLVMLRMLTSMPAGKVRLTIIDPSGLGENFGAFMHLADYDEQLVAGRIWTDPKHIDERLSLIAEHMEKVLQKYLRNEFATIQDYNRSAGEVAEPYHVVVAANFPAGFTDAAARRLVSISAAGPRCGVYTLISVDQGLRLPHEFNLNELLVDAVHLDWADERLTWRYPLFEKLPLELDRLPDADLLIEVLRWAGRQSREASKVEVPFALVAPSPEMVWTGDNSRELVVPIGRAGAKELQSLRLGLGTSQHVVTAGKTGSGKSTLLHALITNAALCYSPDQVEFYLVDFKKGVEFKAYATGALPQARVIAIESEREFGVSVLERLDQELRRRGELFRSHGVQDVAGFRRAAPDTALPRTLLIIDEFQELFVADDKLAQDAALLLDRLVRQGRAFGIHVLLGSQTLSGAYSLARSTIGQMAVRIALECSEADAHLILSDENTAARLLSRPGEAIYNDQNGLLTGNHPFQVVWLPDAERQKYLATLRKQAETYGEAASAAGRPAREPTIIFEGNIPADPRDNPDLVASIEHPERTTHQEPKIWLGSAVRIEPATNLTLRRQGGHNLAIIGQQEELAAGMLAGAVVALAVQHGEAGARFTILDGTRSESRVPGVWSHVAEAVGETVEVVPPRNAAAAMNALADEVARRAQSPEERYGSLYLVIHDLAQFRDLRQTEDDFSFSFSSGNGKPPAVDRRFRDLLKEGPAVGVHVLLWCESYNSLTRSVDRLTLREIEFRVATQMSAADSTSLIDSPAAALLGEHRAILYRDDLGTQTKFRPYGRPTQEWLAWCAERFRREAATKI